MQLKTVIHSLLCLLPVFQHPELYLGPIQPGFPPGVLRVIFAELAQLLVGLIYLRLRLRGIYVFGHVGRLCKDDHPVGNDLGKSPAYCEVYIPVFGLDDDLAGL